MKVLIISDLHLSDRRHYDMTDEVRLEKLGCFIRETGVGAVLNLGDTVSRKPLLLDKYETVKEGFGYYLKWRKTFGIPFAECAIHREIGFFSQIMGQEIDQLFEIDSETAIITMLQQGDTSYNFAPAQEEFLADALDRCQGKTVIIGTHHPFPGSCSRKEDVFLKVSDGLREKLDTFPGRVIWCGGHFHWDQEPPKVAGSLTALYPSRFRMKERNDYTYTSIVDTSTGEISVHHHDF
jgi:3',5'-cyclic AMP phosphodiesterase CpdA